MFNIDIERLIDLVEEERSNYADYCKSAKTLYNGPFDKLAERKKHLEYADKWHTDAQNSVTAICEVLRMETEARDRLYIAARAVIRWRISTNYEHLIPDNMADQLRRFIFGPPAAPSIVCERCGCWEV